MRSSHVLLTLALSLSLVPAAGRADGPGRSKLLANGTGKTVIRKIVLGNDMTVAILSRAGTAIVAEPMNMPRGVVPDVVTVSHGHHVRGNHLDNGPYLEEARSAKIMVQELGTWTVKDARIVGLPASHDEKAVDPTAPTIVTYLFEVDGLRIADLSCNGQRQLERDQLAALGKIDVALISEENGDAKSSYAAATKARDLMKQLGARIVIPLSHHLGDMEVANDTVAELAGGKLETVNGELALTPEDLKGTGQRVIHIAPTLAP